jgi:protein-ribulosamine 3-kinase
MAAPCICPKVLAFGSETSTTYMISTYTDLGSLSTASAATLARRMALELHDPTKSAPEAKERFGFGIPTYCGVTRFENGWFDTWDVAYASMIAQLLDGLSRKGSSFKDAVKLGREVIDE